ncbi:MAG TPA: MgtC/SapB family protein [Candidatus Paceibacterota bacterium]|nr:MgtC/SapB family protein [Candidatus Paceibacterota bacterium]
MQFLTDAFAGTISPFDLTILFRLTVATLLGAVIGYEREKAGKIAGLRTHTLVALGSALFTAVSVLLFVDFPSINGTIGYDYHLVANIIVGIGFIGAGAILRNGDHVSGTTTAATLWVAAAIGIASGLGYYKEAIATTALAYVVLTALWSLEKRMHRSVHYAREHPMEANRAWSDEKEAGS